MNFKSLGSTETIRKIEQRGKLLKLFQFYDRKQKKENYFERLKAKERIKKTIKRGEEIPEDYKELRRLEREEEKENKRSRMIRNLALVQYCELNGGITRSKFSYKNAKRKGRELCRQMKFLELKEGYEFYAITKRFKFSGDFGAVKRQINKFLGTLRELRKKGILNGFYTTIQFGEGSEYNIHIHGLLWTKIEDLSIEGLDFFGKIDKSDDMKKVKKYSYYITRQENIKGTKLIEIAEKFQGFKFVIKYIERINEMKIVFENFERKKFFYYKYVLKNFFNSNVKKELLKFKLFEKIEKTKVIRKINEIIGIIEIFEIQRTKKLEKIH